MAYQIQIAHGESVDVHEMGQRHQSIVLSAEQAQQLREIAASQERYQRRLADGPNFIYEFYLPALPFEPAERWEAQPSFRCREEFCGWEGAEPDVSIEDDYRILSCPVCEGEVWKGERWVKIS